MVKNSKIKRKAIQKKHPERRTIIENGVLKLLDEINSQGMIYEGCSVKPKDIKSFKEEWEKITKKLKSSSN